MKLYIYQWGIDPSNQPILIFAKDLKSAKDLLEKNYSNIKIGIWEEYEIQEGIVIF